eukprot:jgi/Astpho2/8512/Aster-x1524
MVPLHPPPSFEAAPLAPQNKKQHYDKDYLQELQPPRTRPENAVQRVADLGVQLILLLSALITKYSPHWALEPEPLNFSAYRKSPRDVLFLRRLLLLELICNVPLIDTGVDAACWEILHVPWLCQEEGVSWTHGLGAGYLHQMRAILYQQPPAENEMVSALFAEFLSHRMHEATVQAWSKPGLLTRVILLYFQAVAIILNVGMCLVYMPLCHEVARLTSEAAARLWLHAAAELDAGQMPLLATCGVPEVTQRFYGRGSGAAKRSAITLQQQRVI